MGTVKYIWMRGFLFLAAMAVPFFLPSSGTPAAPTLPAARKAVVVELFTSEGCSSCPPADELLGRLGQERFQDGVEVIPLGLHVDYWNFQGWTDRFSSAAYSQRQEKYAGRFGIQGPYTPQMVVDGASEFVGSDARRARQAIAQAALRPQVAEIEISAVAVDKLLVRVKAPAATSGEVMLALTEDHLISQVKAGENGGRELRHAAVVRDLRRLGTLHGGNFEAGVPLKLQKDWKREDLRIVIFVQELSSGRIEGAAAIAAASLSPAR